MAAQSPIFNIAAESQTDFTRFNASIDTTLKALETSSKGATNGVAQPAMVGKAERIYNRASYLPAGPGVITPSRNNKQPLYIVLARTSPAEASEREANILAEIERCMGSAAAYHPVPHIVVGYGGEAVQFADLDATTNFLMGQNYPPPKIVTRGTLTERQINAVIMRTALREGGPKVYGGFNKDDKGSGISYGYIQFNQRKGPLAELLQLMREAAPAKFDEIFGTLAPKLIDAAWVKLPSTDLSRYGSLFNRAGLVPEFQEAQNFLAKRDYWAGAADAVSILRNASMKAYALAFDTCVQRGVGFAAAAAREAVKTSSPLITFADWADRRTFSGAPIIVNGSTIDYRRRGNILSDNAFTDADLSKSPPVPQATDPVAAETVVSIKLEGRNGDPVSEPQRNTLAALIKGACDTFQILPSQPRIFGLDMVFPESKTPGKAFDYWDLVSAVSSVTSAAPGAVFHKAEPATALSVRAAAASLQTQLAQTRNNVQSIALMTCYDSMQATGRGQAVVGFSRRTASAAITQENQTRAALAAQGAANSVGTSTAAQRVPGLERGQLVGLFYSFDTGLWSDRKPLGRIA